MAGRWDSKSRRVEGADGAHGARRLRQLRRHLQDVGALDPVDAGQHLVHREHLAVEQQGRADAAHAGTRVLAREEHLGAQVALGHRQLPVGHAVGGQELELRGHDAQHLVDMLGRRADHHGQRSAVLVGRPLGPHRVGQPALLADLLEEAARQAAPQHVVQARPAPSAARRSARPSACRRRGAPARWTGGPRRGRRCRAPGAVRVGTTPPERAGEPPLEVGRHRVVACSRRPPRRPCWRAGSARRRRRGCPPG